MCIHKLCTDTIYVQPHVMCSHTVCASTNYLKPHVMCSHTLCESTNYVQTLFMYSHTLCSASDITLTNFRMLAAGGSGSPFPFVSWPFATDLRIQLCVSTMNCLSVSHISPAYTGEPQDAANFC
jgi:hypothetical protein